MCSANRSINQSAVTTKRLQSLFMGRTSVCLTVVSALLHHRNVICLDTFPRECSPPPPPTNNPFSQPHGFKCEAGGIDVFVSGTPPPKTKKQNKNTVCMYMVCVSIKCSPACETCSDMSLHTGSQTNTGRLLRL